MVATEKQLTYWHTDEGTTPQTARHPWTAVGAGSETIDAKGVTITTVAQLRYFSRPAFDTDQTGRVRPKDQLEIQIRFKGTSATTGGGWESDSAHLLVLDDGERSMGVSIGSTLEWVDPANGDVLGAITTPWAALEERSYRLVKSGTTFWELYVDGAVLATRAYAASPATMFSIPTEAWGWFDVTGSGVAKWQEPETGLNMVLPSNAMVDRYRLNLPVKVQKDWNPRTRALLRAIVGTFAGVMDAGLRLWFEHTAGQRSREIDIRPSQVRAAAFSGVYLPTDHESWTLEGPAAAGFFSVVRERVRIATSTATHWIQFDHSTPINNTEAVYYAAARYLLDSDTSTSALGLVGPFLSLHNAHRQVNVSLMRSIHNPLEFFWLLNDGNLTTTLTNRGEVPMFVDPYQEMHVELYVVARDRVILFVNNRLVEDRPYSDFTAATAVSEAHIGRAGSANIGCVVDVWDGRTLVSFADENYRPRFQQRVSERLLFAGGCERNSRLDAWLRHRHGVTKQRGTDIALSEVRRLACDDDAQRVVTAEPSEWYLEVTYPEVTPIFIESGGRITDVAYEFRALAPNFTPAALRTLLETYILPRSITESIFRALLTTDLTSNTVTAGTTTFNVASVTGFAEGDAITLRKLATGNALTLTYDVGLGRTDRFLRDFGAFNQDAEGSANGVGATDSDLLNDDDDNALWTATSGAVYEGIETKANITPVISSGFSFVAKFTPAVLHDGNLHHLAEILNGVGTGGFLLTWSAAGNVVGTIYDGAGTRQVSAAWDPGAGVESTIGLQYDPSGTNTLRLYIDGAQVDSTDTTGFTPLDPGGGATMSVGARNDGDTDEFRGSLRDVWYWEYAIGAAAQGFMPDDEMTNTIRQTLWAETAALRPKLCYMPHKHSAAVSRYEDDPLQADIVDVATIDQVLWGRWRVLVIGDMGTQGFYRDFIGSTAAAGLDSHKVNNVTAGGTITYAGVAGSTGFATAYGIRAGVAVRERAAIPNGGTTPGTQLWDEVHGVVLDRTATAAGEIRDTTTANPLYQWALGARTRGAYLLEPALRAGANVGQKGGFTADAATAADMVLQIHQSGGADIVERLTLNGTTRVDTTSNVDAYHVLAAGYVPAARTVTLRAHLTDPSGVFRAVSTSANDTQVLYVCYLNQATGEAEVDAITLTGVVQVSGTANARAFLGATLFTAAVGTITITMETGSNTVTVGTIAAGGDALAARRLQLDIVGQVVQKLSGSTSAPRPVGYWGLDEDGQLAADVIYSDSIVKDRGSVNWSKLYGVGVAQLPDTEWVELEGTVLRETGPRAAADALDGSLPWTATTPVEGFDALLDLDLGQDLTEFLTRNFTGSAGVTEDTTITTITPATKLIETPAIAGSFLIGDQMRQGA